MPRLFSGILAAVVCVAVQGTILSAEPQAATTSAVEKPVTYNVRQIVKLDGIKAGAKSVRMWVSIPDDERNQNVLDLDVVSAPGQWSIVNDLENRARFLRVEVANPFASALEVTVDFLVVRKPVHVTVDPKKVAPLAVALQKAFAEHLNRNAPHMKVTPKIQKIADEVCGSETNAAKEIELLFAHVMKVADHYSYSTDPLMPKCGIGDVEACLKQGGGCCTDLNSLFISLARARGIPSRLAMGYRLQEKNVGKLVDPGYRCWVEYFLSGYGWIPADVVEADTPKGPGPARWSSGLTARRIWLNTGREFRLADDLKAGRVNHMSIGYAEIDGVEARLLPEGILAPQITRQVRFTELDTK